MNFKKRFEKRIEEDKKSMYTESDRAFLATLQDMVVERPEGEVIAKHFDFKKPLMIAVACFLVVVLALSLTLYFTLSPKPADDIFYLTDDLDPVESNVVELNSDLTLFYFAADESKYNVVVKKYCLDNGDALYYKLLISVIQGLGFNAEIDIVVKKNVIHDEINYSNDEKLESTISDYILCFTQSITPIASTGVNTIDCMGDMKIGNQTVYIMKYQELSQGEGAFVENIQSMIHIK
ncbi:MAG: hypothetical protein J1F61_01930 [Clostridiales bacterium]|nr:hypothetical protein [Clostridiales bacterium]